MGEAKRRREYVPSIGIFEDLDSQADCFITRPQKLVNVGIPTPNGIGYAIWMSLYQRFELI